MAKTVILDAMIRREDFATASQQVGSAESIRTLSVQSLGNSGMLVPLLRKPDFQRETNHWTAAQVVSFLESFLDNELIPSIILWKSDSYVFVIDGGHRLSALRAWIENDYGDGPVSIGYFSNEIGNSQKKSAESLRKLIDQKVGPYALMQDALVNPEKYDASRVKRARNMATRELSLQWVNGDSEKAESSFFKINTQGTPLDSSEELLLRNRKRSVAIAARSIIRAGTGHKYWSKFSDEQRAVIEGAAKKLHGLFFTPEVDSPIKTLDLPLGGSKSPIEALEMLMLLISISSSQTGESKKKIESFEEDESGNKTSEVLNDCLNVAERMTGNSAGSLGLHPAIYFYTDRGSHMPALFLGTLSLFKEKLKNNNKQFFKDFTMVRAKLEKYLVEKKSLITQALNLARSEIRFLRVSDLIEYLMKKFLAEEEFKDEDVIAVIAPNSSSKVLAIKTSDKSGPFSRDTKSAIYLRDSLKAAVNCQICQGMVDANKAVSYDHIKRKRDGGSSDESNGQMTHPFCNTGYKS
jgi:Protein of unknown function DUF262/HNH endonuclease